MKNKSCENCRRYFFHAPQMMHCCGSLVVCKDLDRWEKNYETLEAENKLLRECVEFYSDEKNWGLSDDCQNMYDEYMIAYDDDGGIIFSDRINKDILCGGKLARKTLKELEQK